MLADADPDGILLLVGAVIAGLIMIVEFLDGIFHFHKTDAELYYDAVRKADRAKGMRKDGPDKYYIGRHVDRR